VTLSLRLPLTKQANNNWSRRGGVEDYPKVDELRSWCKLGHFGAESVHTSVAVKSVMGVRDDDRVQGYLANKNSPPVGPCPTVALCLGTYDGPRGVGSFL
jgi:hypothetical protein